MFSFQFHLPLYKKCKMINNINDKKAMKMNKMGINCFIMMGTQQFNLYSIKPQYNPKKDPNKFTNYEKKKTQFKDNNAFRDKKRTTKFQPFNKDKKRIYKDNRMSKDFKKASRDGDLKQAKHLYQIGKEEKSLKTNTHFAIHHLMMACTKTGNTKEAFKYYNNLKKMALMSQCKI